MRYHCGMKARRSLRGRAAALMSLEAAAASARGGFGCLFSTVVVSNLRLSDLSGRIGGEEFAALLPCSLEEGVLVAERVREAFETSGVVVDDGPVDTTVSIGVAGGPAGTELEVLLASADTALYQAKRGGRNRVETAEELPLSLENWRRKTAGLSAPARATPAVA